MSRYEDHDADTRNLLEIMRKLRDPDGGCPWDLEQDFASIARYTIEEAYEVADAIERGDLDGLMGELGDLLLQVVFHARMAEEKGLFAYADVVQAICRKMIRRHPHVFAAREFGDDATTAEGVARKWEDIKAEERAAKPSKQTSIFDDVAGALPALMRAVKLQNRAAQVGFDWPDARHVTDKIAEEAQELVEASEGGDPAKISEEFGDLMFVMANLARHLKVDPEQSLRAANAKFTRRFRVIERGLEARGVALGEASLEDMEALWREAKRLERGEP
jgi:MazG family protein